MLLLGGGGILKRLLTFLVFSDDILLQFLFSYSNSRHYSRLCQLRTFTGGILVALIQPMLLSEDSFFSFCEKKVKKMSVPKTEGKSSLFHIGNEFPNMISITWEVGFYVNASQFRNLYPDFCQIFLVVFL